MIYFLVAVLLIGLFITGIVALVGYFKERRDENGVEYRAQRAALKKTEKALRAIASGTAGNPILEAQIALDELENYYNLKELS